ncbi:hypothetical protein BGZ95_007855 [Linnemannia exigua]|uniref:Uncharacterized protein n=1 Tax=Linnemannia exigua TaxID=604196 RepID=A0AAD4H6N9_9FUNG|nr:hypothetical protein BGZ95_007855 [Linnemannia exigua]
MAYDQPDPDTFFQAFRSEREAELILIPVVQHPTQGDLYVIWTDITDCFPGATRIQFDNVFIPKLRDKRCYRVKPHGIKYHSGIVLDVVYGDKGSSSNKKIRTSTSNTRSDNIKTERSATSGSRAGEPSSSHGQNGLAAGGKGEPSEDYQSSSSVINGESVPSLSSTGVSSGSSAVSSPRLRHLEDISQADIEDDEDHQYHGDEDCVENGNEDDDRGQKDNNDDQEDRNEGPEVLKEASVVQFEPAPRRLARSTKPKEKVAGLETLETQKAVGVAKNGSSLQVARDTDRTEDAEEEKPDSTDDDERPSYSKELGDPATRELISNTIAECRPALTAMAETNQKFQRVRSTTSSPNTPLGIFELLEHRVKDIFKSRRSWTRSNHSRFFCFLPILEDPPGIAKEETTAMTAAATTLTITPPTTSETKSTTTSTSAPSTTSTSAPSTTSVPTFDCDRAEIRADTRFQFYYICDCGDVPGFEGRWYPHCNLDQGVNNAHHHQHKRMSAETLSQQQLDELIPMIGEYVVAVLEMLLYGVYIDNVLRFPATLSQEALVRILLAKEYFESKGVLSCDIYYHNKTRGPNGDASNLSLDDIEPIAPLDDKTSESFAHKVVKHRWEEYDELIPYRTSEGDVRWICQPHWYDMAPKREWMVARTFSVNPASTKSEYLTYQGAFVAEITNRQRMVDFFLLAGRLTRTSIIRVSLNWDMTTEDEIFVGEAIMTLAAAGLHITIRPPINIKSGSGLIGGCLRLTMAALRNPNLEAFKLFQRSLTKEKEYPVYDERRNILASHFSMEGLAAWTRPEKNGKVKASLTVIDVDRAIKSVRLFAKGLHHFSELCLTIEPVWKVVTIKFAEPGSGKPGCNVEDTDYKNNDVIWYLEKRELCDEVIYKGIGMVDNRFLFSRCLTEVRLEFSLAQDRLKLRDVIKLNRNLKELHLENPAKDDPSQIFEAYKALLANHPSIIHFDICHRHLSRNSSNFAWSNPNDPAKMRLRISCFEGDKVQSLFQKNALIIESLCVDQLQPSESAALEKAMRPKKGTSALEFVSITDPHLMEPSVLDDLKKIILRANLDRVAVFGSLKRTRTNPDNENEVVVSQAGRAMVKTSKDSRAKGGDGDSDDDDDDDDDDEEDETENAIIWADFLVAIRSKLTRLSVRCNGSIFKALESRMINSLDMPRLKDLSLLGSWDLTLFSYPWIEKLLHLKKHRKERIESFHVSGATILPDEWNVLLRTLDFSRLTKFQIEQENPLPPELLGPITDAIPDGKSEMDIFMVSDDRTLDGYALLQYEEKVRAKLAKQNIVVMINGYTIT